MNKTLVASAAAAVALTFAPSRAGAAGLGAFVGYMDTETLGSSIEFGGQIEFDFVPCITLIGRGAYAGGFDDLKIAGPDAHKAVDLSVVPAEVGLMLRPPELFGFLGIYAGGGAGWYYMPGFDVKSGSALVAETEETTDLVGWWVCAGLEVGVPSFHVFLEAKYTGVKKDEIEFEFKDGYAPSGKLSGGIDLSGMTYAAGLRVDW